MKILFVFSFNFFVSTSAVATFATMFSSHASPLASSSVNSPDEILDAISNINLAAPPPSTTVPTSLTGEFSLPLGGMLEIQI